MKLSADLRMLATSLVAPGKGILAADDDDKEMFQRFAAMGIEATKKNLHEYWEVLFTAPQMKEYISGVILCEESLRLERSTGQTFAQYFKSIGVATGMVVDTGTKNLDSTDGEELTDGLAALKDRLASYAELGVQFSKWRAVISIANDKPSEYCVETNAIVLARFAALSQQAGLVPFVEPDVLIDGKHSIARCTDVTNHVLSRVFSALDRQGVDVGKIILKPNMVLAGKDHRPSSSAKEVAEATLSVLKRNLPSSVSGVAFLSGGQSDQSATANLNAMNASKAGLPWPLTFCFGRALQAKCMSVWDAKLANKALAQEAFLHRARLNSLAQLGTYRAELENESAMVQPVAMPA